MAKLELPTLAYVTDFCQRVFPNLDWRRGSGISDLVLKPGAVLFQPFRHEVDVTKVNQSVTNYAVMRREDLDALASNWGKFRQNGSRSTGNVRLYFDTAAEYRLAYLEVYASDGTSFVLVAPVSITITDLLSRKRSDGTYYFDVAVQSVGVGNRYALPAGSITGVKNSPPGIIGAENIEDFTVTSPDETNLDVVNTMFRNLGMRNLVAPASIRSPLFDAFPGIVDIFVAGADHSKMIRDLVTVQINGSNVQLHLGGMADIWVNTSALVSRQVTLSYLPTSRRLRLISAAQAQSNELIYAFSRALITVDGDFSSVDNPDKVLDESVGVFFNLAGVEEQSFVLGMSTASRDRVATKDLISGAGMLPLPTPGTTARGILLGDFTDVNLQNTDVQVGDTIQLDNIWRRIEAKSGRVIRLSPTLETAGPVLSPSAAMGSGPGNQPLITNVVGTATVNSRCVIPYGLAAGTYRVLALDGTRLWLGTPTSKGKLHYETTVDGYPVYRFEASDGATGVPWQVDTTFWVHTYAAGSPDENAYDQTAATWLKILNVSRDAAGAHLTIEGGLPANYDGAVLVGGLRGELAMNTPLYFEESTPASFTSGMRQSYTTGHTKYANVLAADVPVSSDAIRSLGIGVTAEVGDLILVDGGFVPDASIPQTGGDGTKLGLVVTDVKNDDEVLFAPQLDFAIPAGTPFAVVRNTIPMAEVAVQNVQTDFNSFEVADWPLGLGDGTGLMVMFDNINTGKKDISFIKETSAGGVRTLQFKPASSVRTLTMSAGGYIAASPGDRGATVTQISVDGLTTHTGVLVEYVNSTRAWIIAPNNPATDLFNLGTIVAVKNSTALGTPAIVGAMGPYGYYDPASTDIGKMVRQGTYTGILDSFDPIEFTWGVKPLTQFDVFDRMDIETFVDRGTGQPTHDAARGYLRTPATQPLVNAGLVGVVLQSTPTFENADTVKLFSRFGRGGGMFDGTRFKVFPDPTVNSDPFGNVAKDTDVVIPLLGDFADAFTVANKSADPYFVDVKGSGQPELVRIVNAPASRQMSISSPISSNSTSVNIPGSGIGLWGGRGRVLLLTINGVAYRLAIDAPITTDSINLLTPLPVGIYPGQNVTYEIVEGFLTPYFVSPMASMKSYRCARVPQLYDTVYVGSHGSQISSDTYHHKFMDSKVNFAPLIGGSDFDSGDVVLFVDSGPQATAEPIQVSGLADDNTLLLRDFTFTTDASNVAYHLGFRNHARNREQWIPGTIDATDGTKVTLVPPPALQIVTMSTTDYAAPDTLGAAVVQKHTIYVNFLPVVTTHRGILVAVDGLDWHIQPDSATDIFFSSTSEPVQLIGLGGVGYPAGVVAQAPWDYRRNGGDQEWTVALQIHPVEGLAQFETREITGRYDPATRVLMLDAAHTEATTDFGATGFRTGLKGKRVLMMPVRTDRSAASNSSGQVLSTFNYYNKEFFVLPTVRIKSVEVLDPQTLLPTRTVPYSLVVDTPGLRYSHLENNSIYVDDVDAVFKPIRISYVGDPSIELIDNYLNAYDTRVSAGNQHAKRMETISVDVTVTVRSDQTETALSGLIAGFVNALKSTERLTKDKIIKFLYEQGAVNEVVLPTFRLDAVYLSQEGEVSTLSDVSEIFGAETACYVANTIAVTKLSAAG